MNPYEILDIETDSTLEQIKKAYREKSKEVHPDKPGGSQEAFIQVNEAYVILSDPQRRKRYDETGNSEPEEPFEKAFEKFTQDIFLEIVKKNDVKHTDIVEEFKGRISIAKTNITNDIKKEEYLFEKCQTAKNRLTSKGDAVLHKVLDLNIAHHNQMILELNATIGFLHKCEQIINDDYNYNFDKMDVQTIQIGSFTVTLEP